MIPVFLFVLLLEFKHERCVAASVAASVASDCTVAVGALACGAAYVQLAELRSCDSFGVLKTIAVI